MTLIPILPIWAIVAVGLVLLALLGHGSVVLLRKRVSGRWVSCLGVLRVIAIGVFIACLLRPVVSYTRTIHRKPDFLVLVDTSGSMAGPGAPSAPTRLAQVLDTMARTGLQRKLRDTFDLHWFAFDRSARPLAAGDLANLQPVGAGTDFARSVRAASTHCRQAAAEAGLPEAGPARILLVTDGNDQGTRDVVDVARQLGCVIHALAPPDVEERDLPAGITIAGVQAAQRVLLGSDCRFRCTIRQTGMAGVPLVLELTEDDQPVMTHEFAFDPKESERHINLVHQPTMPGEMRYTFRVSSTNVTALRDCPSYELTVKVLDRRSKVLIIEDTWRWEFKFLRRVLEDDPSFSFTSFLSRGAGMYMQFAEPDHAVKLGGFPQTRTELEWFDIIVLGDVKPQSWPGTLAPSIYRLVVEHGKSLVVVAGPNIAHLVRQPLLECLLPVQITPASARPIAGPIKVRPSAAGETSSFLYTPRGDSASIDWSDLPPLDQIYPPLRKRPAATILLETPEHRNTFGNLVVVAEHTVGRGRVVFIGTDTLWKWQMVANADESGNTPYRVFWEQALRAVAPARRTGGDISVWLQTDRSKYAAGQNVRVCAELESDRKMKGIRIESLVSLPDSRDIPLALLPDPVWPRIFRAEFEASATGHYSIVATAFVDGKRLPDVTTGIDVAGVQRETARSGIDTRALERIASRTGGNMVDPALPGTWPVGSKDGWAPILHTRTIDLWSDYHLPLLLVLVLGLDWLIRLLRGFV